MRQHLLGLARKAARLVGVDIVVSERAPVEFDRVDRQALEAAARFTMTDPPRMFAVVSAVRYIEAAGIPGAVVECGVWRGGSMMLAAQVVKNLGRTDRHLYLFDTFEGMSAPGPRDVSYRGEPAAADEYFARSAPTCSSHESTTPAGWP
jgi:hypothetical protein